MPLNSMTYDEFMEKVQKTEGKKEEIEYTPGYYQFGPYGDICRSYEPILRKSFPKLSTIEIEAILKDIASAAFELLDPSSFI